MKRRVLIMISILCTVCLPACGMTGGDAVGRKDSGIMSAAEQEPSAAEQELSAEVESKTYEFYHVKNLLDTAEWLGHTAEENKIPSDYVTDGHLPETQLEGTLFGEAADGTVYFSSVNAQGEPVAGSVLLFCDGISFEDGIQQLSALYGEPVSQSEEPYVQSNGGAVSHAYFQSGTTSIHLSCGSEQSYMTLALEWQPDADLTPGEPVVNEDTWSPYVAQRQILLDEDSMCGVVYLGYVDPMEEAYQPDSAYYTGLLEDSGYTDGFEFLRELPADHFVDAGGEELFLLFPFDEDAAVSVYAWTIDEENDYQGVAGEELYHSENGAPILLRCNISDIMPNSLVEIRDSEGSVLEWNPFLSLENGRVQNTSSDSKVVWDFTHYPE